MCGKFTQRRDIANVVRLSEAFAAGAQDDAAPMRETAMRAASGFDGGADETVTPMRYAQVIALDAQGARKSVAMRWGLVRDTADGKPHIHARAETIDSKPTFRDCFAKRRGIVVTTTFNEGEEVGSKTQQYVLTPLDNAPVAIAVVWDSLREEGGKFLLSFAMLTVAANPLIATITDRMPALVEAEDWARWLGEEPATTDELKAMLRPSAREFDMRRATKPAPKRAGSGQAELF